MTHGDKADWLASSALRRLGLGDVTSPHMLSVAHGLRVKVSHRVVGEALAFSDHPRRRAFVTPRHDARLTWAALAHELGHQTSFDASDPDAESDELADNIGMRLQVPSRHVRRVVRDVGLDPAKILRHYPDVLPATVFRRVAECTDTIAHIHGADGRAVVACRYREVNTALASEDRLVAEVLASGAPVHDLGDSVTAWPFKDVGGVTGVVVLADLWALAEWLERVG